MAFLSLVNAHARRIILTRDTPVYAQRRGYVEELGTFRAGTEVILYNERARLAGYGSATMIKRIVEPNRIDSNYRYNLAIDINRTSHFDEYYFLDRHLEGDRRDIPRRDRVQPRDRVIVREPVVDYTREYQVCYETPRRRVVTINEDQRRRGNRNAVGGGLAVIGGQILGAVTGNDDLGDIISVIGAGFLAVGAVQVASSQEVFYTDMGLDCKTYYTADSRVYRFSRQGQRCSTTRYYSNRWGSEYEYFETECRGRRNTRYISFERSYEIYAY